MINTLSADALLPVLPCGASLRRGGELHTCSREAHPVRPAADAEHLHFCPCRFRWSGPRQPVAR